MALIIESIYLSQNIVKSNTANQGTSSFYQTAETKKSFTIN